MATNDDEPMHLYEVFQNCFNKIANKQPDKSREMPYGLPYSNQGEDALQPDCLGSFPGAEPLASNDPAYFQYGNAAQQRLLPPDTNRASVRAQPKAEGRFATSGRAFLRTTK